MQRMPLLHIDKGVHRRRFSRTVCTDTAIDACKVFAHPAKATVVDDAFNGRAGAIKTGLWKESIAILAWHPC